MKRSIWILICFLGISVSAATEESKEKFTAALPDGTTIELVGLRYFDVRYLEQFKDRNIPWWRPDGSPLPNSPDSTQTRGAGGDSHLFLIRVTGDSSCDGRAVGPWNTTLSIKPVTQKTHGFEEDDLRNFTLRFSSNQKQASIKLGLATSDWKMTDRWSIVPRWTPYNLILSSSDQLILRCPEQVGSDVIVEVTQIITERATRLVLFDKDSNQYESEGKIQGEGVGLVRHVHRFRNLDRSRIERIEFQARPYEYWITFRNVSLQTGQKTHVEVDLKKPGTLLPGEILPNFDGIKIDFHVQDSKNKMLLFCFFDMQQRPSRNCITQLAKRVKELKQKSVTIVAVQASKIDENKLNEWVKKYKIPFSVGKIEGDAEKIRFTWGVKSLPWLILTDRKHIVHSEGFALSELNTKIKEVAP
ncbi:MAG: redoxin domain-containing protein [Planctomycetota bacterium]